MSRFFQLTLRTTDVDAARAFYAAFLGDAALHAVQLHEQARARGAVPHWLGYVDVDDVDRASAAFVRRGASSLGPKWVNPQGLEAAVLRDPGGAIVALAKPSPEARTHADGLGPQVAWHVLNTPELERARTNYFELFGWASASSPIDAGRSGVFHPFAWQPGGPVVGAMAELRGRPDVHPHWLFFMRVAALAAALDAVRAGGGTVVGPFALPDGAQIAACEDAQGAAFGLLSDRLSETDQP